MKLTLILATTLLAAVALAPAQDQPAATPTPPNPLETPSPEGAKVYFIDLKDGQKVKSPVTIRFGLKGMGVCPAGLYLDETGHHHLLVNMDASELDPKLPIPTVEDKCLHYGKGQTEVTLELPKGTHTLQLAFANFAHMLHKPAVISEKISITVE